MNLEIKQKWLEALRSGKYQQADGFLHFGNSFCCLGVLADIVGCEWRVSNDPLRNAGLFPYKDENRMNALSSDGKWANFLSYDMIASVGLTSQQQHELADMNDNGKTFIEIADHIEATL